MKILAIESSCDETAAAVISVKLKDKSLKTEILSNIVASQIDIHAQYGGVFPEIASRAHSENIIPVVEEAILKSKKVESNTLNVISKETNNLLHITNNELLASFDAIAVTTGPGLIGSLLVGVNFAKSLAYATKKPIIGINHWLGHIYSCFVEEIKSEKLKVESKNTTNLPEFPLLALIVSGGHTGLVLMKSHTEYETIGQTLDDAAGEAFDKVAKLLDLGYPGGPAISAEAEKFKINNSKSKIIEDIRFPRSMLNRKDTFDFSFSGLKTSVLNKVKQLSLNFPLSAFRSQIAYEFQQAVIDILIGRTLQAAEKFKPKSICLCGGVSANKELRSQMESSIQQFNNINNITIDFHIPPLPLCGDNAVMIGVAAAYCEPKEWTTFNKINANSNLEL